MSYFRNTLKGPDPAPRVHPLLLSLTAVYNESPKIPSISSVSEDDIRAQRGDYYTPPSELPSLDIHFDGQEGMAQNCDNCVSWLTLAACRECMASAAPNPLQSQVNVANIGDAVTSTPSAAINIESTTSHPQDDSEMATDVTTDVSGKGKNRQQASGGMVRSESYINMAVSC